MPAVADIAIFLCLVKLTAGTATADRMTGGSNCKTLT